MPTKIPKAKPTEYNGVLYRSKSEAMFAFILKNYIEDVMFRDRWEYEPEWFVSATDGWKPDFCTVGGLNRETLLIEVIEYKPTMPTNTWLDTIMSRVRQVHCSDLPFDLDLRVAIGPFFTGEPFFVLNCIAGVGDWSRRNWPSLWREQISAAKQYRFDLKHDDDDE